MTAIAIAAVIGAAIYIGVMAALVIDVLRHP